MSMSVKDLEIKFKYSATPSTLEKEKLKEKSPYFCVVVQAHHSDA